VFIGDVACISVVTPLDKGLRSASQYGLLTRLSKIFAVGRFRLNDSILHGICEEPDG
jgi:hypothetical protein